ncbi:hypothetical protein DUI87_08488 [Hirundo rustica rustica]|uniref:Integrase-type domain-containing protein n=1 Tax=Hirundo rustica rustica TaxID=333673 RepID=A0A3M0KSY4_HIRRU|nr:hypothetical protein DUI87_08488 [Hirundo rustica rustica]
MSLLSTESPVLGILPSSINCSGAQDFGAPSPALLELGQPRSSCRGFFSTAHADKLTMTISGTLPNIFEQAKLNRAFFHQNAQALMGIFHISKSQAKKIISACPDCELVQPPASMGAVNPRAKLKENPLVLIRNPETGQSERPFKLITWGKGFACVFTAVGLAAVLCRDTPLPAGDPRRSSRQPWSFHRSSLVLSGSQGIRLPWTL